MATTVSVTSVCELPNGERMIRGTGTLDASYAAGGEVIDLSTWFTGSPTVLVGGDDGYEVQHDRGTAAAGKLVAYEAGADAAALAEAFVSTYGGPRGRMYFEEFQHQEIILDDVWPGWRTRKPWFGVDPDTEAAIKMPLGRRRQLLMGWGAHGQKLIWDGNTPLALSILPPEEHVEPYPDVVYERQYSRPHLAASTKLPLKTVEAAMDAFRHNGRLNAFDWCKKWAAEHPPARKPRAKKATAVKP